MAWYVMEYRCGHNERVQLYGKCDERKRRLEWAKDNKDCPDCYKAKMGQERQQQNERAASLINEIGFANLIGSEKQIAWANTIRQKCYEELTKMLQEEKNRIYLVKALSLEISSQWWIENRTASETQKYKIILANYPIKTEALKKEIAEAKNLTII